MLARAIMHVIPTSRHVRSKSYGLRVTLEQSTEQVHGNIACMYVGLRAHTLTCMYVGLRAYTFACMYVGLRTHTFACMYVGLRAYTFACMGHEIFSVRTPYLLNHAQHMLRPNRMFSMLSAQSCAKKCKV